MDKRLDTIEAKLDTLIGLLSNNGTTVATGKAKKTKVTKVVKSGNAILTIYNDIIIVTGYTYNNKEVIKSIGGKWNKDQKGWEVKTENKDKLIGIVNSHFDSSRTKEINENLFSKKDEIVNTGDHLANECFINSDSDSD
jgi:hypothetical protein